MRASTRTWDGADPVALARELRRAVPDPASIAADVAAVIERVRDGGDASLIALTQQHDGVAPLDLLLGRDAMTSALDGLGSDIRAALESAAENIERTAGSQMDASARTEILPQGQRVASGRVAVGAAAIYAPGGRAVYPSSVLMGVVPARVAGVERVLVASPPQDDGMPAPAVLAAASIAGADAVLAAGGAHAIAALAHGTESVAPVDVIAGPGGPWVQEAKLQVSRVVGIDGYAGPSELMVICDGAAKVEWLALDLCAQAEHGADGPLVLAGDDEGLLERIGARVAELAAERPTVADAPLELVVAPSLEAAAELASAFAPEHLQVDCREADAIADLVPTAGCVFVGPHAGTAFGDYAAGSNHTLPTGGAGRFTGPLGPETFMRRTARVGMDAEAAAALAPIVVPIAEVEGFPVHGESASARAPRDRSS